MKRALLGTLWTGAIAAAVAIGLQLSGLLTPPAAFLGKTIGLLPNDLAGFGNFVFVILLSFAVAWTMLEVTGLGRQAVLFVFIILELLGAAWILQRFAISFAPWPAIVATVAATALALGWNATRTGRHSRAAAKLFAGRLAPPVLDRLTENGPLDFSAPSAREVSFVFCEIANQAELIDDLAPVDCAQLTREFIACASERFLRAGGYLQGADGEGVRVLFGFPNQSPQHAAEAARAALAFRDAFRAAAEVKPESLGKIDLRIGISSGTIVASHRNQDADGEIVIAGEPLEIARRLARANEVYGSQILLDPRALHGAANEIVARPIDFLRSAAAHDRLEIYELIALVEGAKPEELARRDRFWTAVVYFREGRWDEARAEFNRARGDNSEHDRPLQWYLRRLEPVDAERTAEPVSAGDRLVAL